MSRLPVLLVLLGLAVLAVAEEEVRTPVRDEQRVAAAEARADDASQWADHDREVQRVLEENAAVRERWMRRGAPPRPDLRPLDLPPAYLRARLAALLVETPRDDVLRRNALAEALVAVMDERGLDLLLEAYHVGDTSLRREHLARLIATGATVERAAALVRSELESSPPVRVTELAFLLLDRHRDALPDTVRTLGRDWLASYGRGPGNGRHEDVWALRLRVGDASDRVALVPYLLGDSELLYCLRVILDAPLPHPALADALRTRRDRMSEHESSYLTGLLRRALLLTDPDGELATFLEHVQGLVPQLNECDVLSAPAQEFYALYATLLAVDAPDAREALRGWVVEPRLTWRARFELLRHLLARDDAESDRLSQWWREHAPRHYVEALDRL